MKPAPRRTVLRRQRRTDDLNGGATTQLHSSPHGEGAAQLVGLDPVPEDDPVAMLFDEQARPLLGMLTALTGDRGVAEDLLQETFVRVHRSWARIEDGDRAVAYVRTTALNLARSRFRRLAVSSRHRIDRPREVPSPEHAAIERDEQQAILRALRRLPVRQRECLVLRFYEDMSETEIAATLGVSPNSVKTHVRRGLARLRQAFGEEAS